MFLSFVFFSIGMHKCNWRIRSRIDDLLVDDDEGWDEIGSYEAQKRWTLSNEELTKTTGEGNAFADSRIMDLAFDYNFPLSYIADMVVSLGARPPIRDNDRISELLDGEQAFALLEALTSLDGADVESMYLDSTLEDVADLMEMPVDALFAACAEKGFSLPHGLQTQLRRDQLTALIAYFEEEPPSSDFNQQQEENRKMRRGFDD
mmetsp:Transcript_20811/g.26940  ORF Transcript_20811/g.26940 Transcript_20811/m.26940 type:complete len:205 (+) Transcript_20811:50-664(+)